MAIHFHRSPAFHRAVFKAAAVLTPSCKKGSNDEAGRGNGLTLRELEQIDESAQHSETSEAKTILRLAAALQEALQAKVNAFSLIAEFQKNADASEK